MLNKQADRLRRTVHRLTYVDRRTYADSRTILHHFSLPHGRHKQWLMAGLGVGKNKGFDRHWRLQFSGWLSLHRDRGVSVADVYISIYQ